jgi:hypothetical protein
MLLATGMFGTFGATSTGEPIRFPDQMQRFEEERYARERRALREAVVFAYGCGRRPRHLAKQFGLSKQQIINVLKNAKVWNG